MTDWAAGEELAWRKQFPLQSGYSVTVHSLQSTTLSGGELFLDFEHWGNYWKKDLSMQRRLLYVGITRVVSAQQLLLRLAGINPASPEPTIKKQLAAIFKSDLEARQELLKQIRARDTLAVPP